MLGRVKTYYRFNPLSGTAEALTFEASQYREAGTLYTPAVGMHKTTALELTNKWNRTAQGKFIYWV